MDKKKVRAIGRPRLKMVFKPNAIASGGWGRSDHCLGGVSWNLHKGGLGWWPRRARNAPGAKSRQPWVAVLGR